MPARIPYFQVDSFAERPFAGNPAGVCVLDDWPDAAAMQAIAAENAMPATAFLRREGEGYALRWFTPRVEEEMCGHGTLAAAWVVLERLEPGRDAVTFATRAGPLTVAREGGRYLLDVPARAIMPCAAPAGLAAAIGVEPLEVLRGASYVAVLADAGTVARLSPDLARIAALDLPGVIVTAPGAGHGCDIASRYFAPAKGIPEDPATGSLHAQVVPFWAGRLGRTTLVARQLSRRGATIGCELRGDRVRLSAAVAPYLAGTIELPDQPASSRCTVSQVSCGIVIPSASDLRRRA
ncbi:MAG: PhzF family phenazine biosynthesis protein [Alphaproteobacteria bacterium]|nr:PhzF family phenazine biosynthesis protein [Alphaproteobacteria bacterium]